MSRQALSHITVLDVTQYVAGPYCTRLLADFGAQVIKVEPPEEGDGARKLGPFPQDRPDPEKSGLFLYLNNNKKGITLNLRQETGKELFKRLLQSADIVVESFQPGVMEELGLGYQELSKLKPSVVLVSVSNFGQTGPYRDFKGSHMVATALGGWMYYLGQADRPPVQPGGRATLYVAALHAAAGALAAHRMAQLTGVGQHVDISLMECAMAMLPTPTLWYTMQKQVIKRGMWGFPTQGLLKCKDGWVGVNSLTEDHWVAMCAWLGLEHLTKDPKYATAQLRWERSAELRQIVEAAIQDRGKEELFHSGQLWKVAVGLVSTAEDIARSQHLNERGFFVDVEYPQAGRLRQPGPPARLNETPWSMRSPAPMLGEHNAEVLGGHLGLSRGELTLLREQGAI